MKRIISFLVCIILMMSVCITASAAGSSTLNGNSSVTVGSNIEFTVNVSGCSDATSIAVAVSYDGGFELVSGTWLKSGSITKFDTATNKGALGGLSTPDVNGNLFKLVLKAKTASASNQNVSVNVIAKNGSTEIMNVTPSKSVKIDCATHTYGAYSKVNDSQHKHTCTVCGHTETANHTWNGGTVTKAATCKETGVKTYTCTACNATKTENIAKTANHSYGAWTTTKEPTCTDAGTQTRTCSVCGNSESKSVSAKGHSWGGYQVTKQPTCADAGTQTRTCSVCGKVETQEIAKLTTHSYKAVQVVPPTTTTQGYTVYKCTVCGATYNGNYTNPTSKTTYSIKLNTASSGDSAKYANSAVSLTFKGSVTKTVNTSNKTFQVPDGLADGTYTLQLGCANFAERSYTVTVKGGNLTADPKAELNLYGDIDSDGKLTTTDLMLLKRSLINMVTFNDYQTRIADVDKSGKVQLNDVTLIKRHLINIKKLW